MTKDKIKQLDDALALRLAIASSARIGSEVTFDHWDTCKKTGASIPVFRAHDPIKAQSLGLRIVAN